MKFAKIFIPCCLFFVIVSISFISCRDDFITPPNNEPAVIDSAFFDWEFIHIPAQDIFDIYAADSDNVFVLGNPQVYHVKDTTVNIIGNFNKMRYIQGTGVNNFFIGGSYLVNNISYSRIVSWNGSNFSEIQTPLDSSGPICAIYTNNENDVWFSTASNKVYNYSNSIIKTTYLPDNIDFSDFYVKDNKLYLMAQRVRNTVDIFYAFIFEDSTWKIAASDTLTDSSDITGIDIVGDDFVQYRKKSIYLFTGNSWVKAYETPDIAIVHGAGRSVEDFLSTGYLSYEVYSKFFYRINNQWYYQNNFLPPFGIINTQIARIIFKDDQYFSFFLNRFDNYLIKARYRKVVANGQ